MEILKKLTFERWEGVEVDDSLLQGIRVVADESYDLCVGNDYLFFKNRLLRYRKRYLADVYEVLPVLPSKLRKFLSSRNLLPRTEVKRFYILEISKQKEPSCCLEDFIKDITK